ncbi:hypothetical protein ACH4YN_37955 [Streptomyces griseofuscus]|uniref:hypothetical protein n=1 Tax=Streptomyces griseofuscus TaxID=146922 RepID=UPI00378AAD1C
MPKEIIPSAVYPAGTAIPTAPPLPAAPHGTPNLPPWRTAAPPPPPPPPPAAPQPVPAPDPGPIEHRVTVEVVYVQPEVEVEEELGRWARLSAAITGYVSPWKALGALAAAVIPIPWTGYSAATTWAFTMGEARAMHPALGYVIALGAFGLAVRRLTVRRSLLALFATAVTLFGIVGAADWFDAVVIITGVHR